jgi:hypothetical protein
MLNAGVEIIETIIPYLRDSLRRPVAGPRTDTTDGFVIAYGVGVALGVMKCGK